ncbi:MAG: DNA/RNA non-specific endonuclease [Pyrinomonadaceae bacterium]|nr:DNA/RNA non-specific endonuclease [Pyrinomonadaceae bacterium]
MKKYLFLISLSIAAAFYIFDPIALAQVGTSDIPQPSPNLVISQFQPGTTAVPNDEFIEIHNNGGSPVDLNGYRVVYRSQNGTNDVGPFAVWTTPTVLQPGQYYLIASTSYTGSATPNVTYNNTACACSLSATQGGLAIRLGDQNTGAVIDAVGWGTTTNIFFEGTKTTAPGSGNSQGRKDNGCQDTDDNLNDFAVLNPFAPRNQSTTPFPCSGSGTTLFAAMNANPTTVAPSGNVLLTVTVIPATTPPSTGISVVGNLVNIGGSANQTFFDNGTNGDVTAGDNIFSFSATIPAGTTGGVKNVTAVASDAQARTANINTNITVNAPLPDEDPLILGNPSNATPDIANENNYLMFKPQYNLSYSRANATPNWVAWRLDSTWVGTAPRQDDYREDPALPAGWYRVQDNDYSGSGYDRGHMCPSGDRTRSIPDNSATFLMTNFVPQYGPNNQGPWNDFEVYLRTIVSQGNEIYIFTGGNGNIGTIAQGRVVIPQVTWKVVLILPNGSNDLQRVTRQTRAFGIIVPNGPPVTSGNPWRNFRVTVDAVEALTKYNFFSNIPKNTQELIERKVDTQ